METAPPDTLVAIPVAMNDQLNQLSTKNQLPHMAIARSQIGVHEVAGPAANPKIIRYLDTTGIGTSSDETPWCAAFVGYCLQEANIKASGGANARSYLQWGKPTKTPKVGDIVVFWRGSPSSWKGHVAFFVRFEGDYVVVLGGNQADSVNYQKRAKSTVLGYRTVSTPANSKTIMASAVGSVATLGFTTLAFVMPSLFFTPEDAQRVVDFAATLPGTLGIVVSIVGQAMFAYIAFERFRKMFKFGV